MKLPPSYVSKSFQCYDGKSREVASSRSRVDALQLSHNPTCITCVRTVARILKLEISHSETQVEVMQAA
jgi:hypothetical protein